MPTVPLDYKELRAAKVRDELGIAAPYIYLYLADDTINVSPNQIHGAVPLAALHL